MSNTNYVENKEILIKKQKNLLKKIIQDNKYENPDNVFEKSNKILNFLINSNKKEDVDNYFKLVSKIELEHDLKSIFDFFFKNKKNERLKAFMLMQIQTKGDAIKTLIKDSKKIKARKMLKSTKKDEEEKEKKDDFSVFYKKNDGDILEDLCLSMDIYYDNGVENNISIEKYLDENNKKKEIDIIKKDFKLKDKHFKNLLDNLPEVYKQVLFSKEDFEVNAILNLYVEYRDEEFNHLHMDKAIEIINFRKNMGMPLIINEVSEFNLETKEELKI